MTVHKGAMECMVYDSNGKDHRILTLLLSSGMLTTLKNMAY